MVRVWYHDGLTSDPSDLHMMTPGQFLSAQQLKDETGVEVMKFDAASLDSNPEFLRLKKERGYKAEDFIIISTDFIQIDQARQPDLEKRMKIFNSEHLHPDEEIRFVSAGSGYFDIRSRDDTWVRLEVTEGDFLVIPTGTYHRFYLDTQGYVKLRRFFTEAPSWIAFPRPEGDMYTAKPRDVVQDRAVLVEAN